MSSVYLPNTPLPAYVDSTTAFVQVIALPAPFLATRLLHTVDGTAYLIPITLTFGLNTGAAAATREVLYVVLDANGNEVVQVAATGTQAANFQAAYTWAVDVGSGYSDGAANFVMPLPAFPLAPGWSAGVQVNSLQAGDTSAGCTFVVTTVPTGSTAAAAATTVAVPTPLLL